MMHKHLRLTLFLALMGLIPPFVAAAQEEPTDAEQSSGADEEEQAAKHFAEGRKLYAEGKFKEAIEALLKAYELRPAPPILLNIARTYEKLGDKKNALKFYKEFLLKARNVDPNRAQVEAVVKELEKQVGGTVGAVTSAEGTEAPAAATTDGSEPSRRGKQQLIHTPVDTTKVNHAVTIVAELPAGVVADRLLVHFRQGGERHFQNLSMEAQGEAYVAQIPAENVTSTSLQYYVEAIRGTGRNAVVAQAGTKLTPHIIVIEGGVPLSLAGAAADIRSPYRRWAWVASGATAALVAGAVAGMVLARDRANAVETRARDTKINCDAKCQEGIGFPKQRFDQQVRDWESEGQTFATMGYVFLGLGVVAAGATAYLWYQDQRFLRQERGRRALRGARALAAPWVTTDGAGLLGRIDF